MAIRIAIEDAQITLRIIGDCPVCGAPLTEVGDAGIVDYDGRWDAQAERLDCAEGHTVFVVATTRIKDSE